MQFKDLRAHIKKIAPAQDYVLENCDVVIDGRTFFKDTYMNSGCEFIYGGEYDRYAQFLKMILNFFIKNNVQCYIIFNGAMEANLETRKEIHQKVLDRAAAVLPGADTYCEPIFTKDVLKQLLDELHIKYFIAEHDSTSLLLKTSQNLNCPLITKNYEYSLIYTSCISPKSINFDANSERINCQIFRKENSSKNFGLKNYLLPVFFALVDDQSCNYDRLEEIIDFEFKQKRWLHALLKWTRSQKNDVDKAVARILYILSEKEGEEFQERMREIKKLLKYPKYLRNIVGYLSNNNKAVKLDNWFTGRVGIGDIAIPYINLIKNGTFSGSWLVYDKDRDDAMLVALDIALSVHEQYWFLHSQTEAKITFIGRKDSKSCIWEIRDSGRLARLRDGFDFDFKDSLEVLLPGFDLDVLGTAPKDCQMLLIALVYFTHKRMDLKLVYSIIFSYIMVGPVTAKVGLIRRRNFMGPSEIDNDIPDANGLMHKDCLKAVDKLIDYFYVTKEKKRFNRYILHSFAEFQHCLQHLNYLNKTMLKSTIDCTTYYKTINATFIYNMYFKMLAKESLLEKFEECLKDTSVMDLFKKILNVFEVCLLSTKNALGSD